jgi:hypothetical protein
LFFRFFALFLLFSFAHLSMLPCLEWGVYGHYYNV